MKTYEVVLGRMVRQERRVFIKAPNEKMMRVALSQIYEDLRDPGAHPWEDDIQWGEEESETHVVHGQVKGVEAEEAEIIVGEDGDVYYPEDYKGGPLFMEPREFVRGILSTVRQFGAQKPGLVDEKTFAQLRIAQIDLQDYDNEANYFYQGHVRMKEDSSPVGGIVRAAYGVAHSLLLLQERYEDDPELKDDPKTWDYECSFTFCALESLLFHYRIFLAVRLQVLRPEHAAKVLPADGSFHHAKFAYAVSNKLKKKFLI